MTLYRSSVKISQLRRESGCRCWGSRSICCSWYHQSVCPVWAASCSSANRAHPRTASSGTATLSWWQDRNPLFPLSRGPDTYHPSKSDYWFISWCAWQGRSGILCTPPTTCSRLGTLQDDSRGFSWQNQTKNSFFIQRHYTFRAGFSFSVSQLLGLFPPRRHSRLLQNGYELGVVECGSSYRLCPVVILDIAILLAFWFVLLLIFRNGWLLRRHLVLSTTITTLLADLLSHEKQEKKPDIIWMVWDQTKPNVITEVGF